jgi:hypothetical protein
MARVSLRRCSRLARSRVGAAGAAAGCGFAAGAAAGCGFAAGATAGCGAAALADLFAELGGADFVVAGLSVGAALAGAGTRAVAGAGAGVGAVAGAGVGTVAGAGVGAETGGDGGG